MNTYYLKEINTMSDLYSACVMLRDAFEYAESDDNEFAGTALDFADSAIKAFEDTVVEYLKLTDGKPIGKSKPEFSCTPNNNAEPIEYIAPNPSVGFYSLIDNLDDF